MANVNFIWNGTDQPSMPEPTSNFYRGPTSGYYRPPEYGESWTGIGLTYDPQGRHPYPTGGTIQTWSFEQTTNGSFSFQVTGLSIRATLSTNYTNFLGTMVAGRDDWHGNDADNYFYWSVGGDAYHGGEGVDTVIAVGATKSMLIGDRPTISHQDGFINVSGIGNTSIRLDAVERLQFTDVSVAFDLDGHAGDAARIVGAVFGKELLVSKELTGAAIGILDAGMEPTALMGIALDVALGANYTHAALVALLYENITGSAPSASEAQLYESMLADGLFTPTELAWAAADSTANATNIDLIGLAASGLEYLPWNG